MSYILYAFQLIAHVVIVGGSVFGLLFVATLRARTLYEDGQRARSYRLFAVGLLATVMMAVFWNSVLAAVPGIITLAFTLIVATCAGFMVHPGAKLDKVSLQEKAVLAWMALVLMSMAFSGAMLDQTSHGGWMLALLAFGAVWAITLGALANNA